MTVVWSVGRGSAVTTVLLSVALCAPLPLGRDLRLPLVEVSTVLPLLWLFSPPRFLLISRLLWQDLCEDLQVVLDNPGSVPW